MYKNLDEMMTSLQNYKVYRSELSKALNSNKPDLPPILPYLGVYLRDITFADDGNPTITENNLLNFEKAQILGNKSPVTIVTYNRYRKYTTRNSHLSITKKSNHEFR